MKDVLVICDDSPTCQLIKNKIACNGNVVNVSIWPLAPETFDRQFDFVFFDMMTFSTGMDDSFHQITQWFRKGNPWTQLVVLAPREHIRQAVTFVRQGANDYITYPIDEAEFELVIESLERERASHFELEYLREQFWKTDWQDAVITNNPAMQRVYRDIRRVAPTIATVLLLGQTGTGKGWMAQLIHRHSHRSDEAFVAVHCGAIPDTLIESELFGHEKGAFTGADRRKIGKFELAQNGTILLDEIGTISPSAQIKLLQVLQDGTFSRLGGEDSLKTNARIIAATNADLYQMAAAGSFRKDLFYRINVFPIQLPPLSHRQEDISHLVDYFIGRLNKKYGKNIVGLQAGVIDALMAYEWPGNLRELENVLERAHILETSSVMTPESFPETLIISSKLLKAMDTDDQLSLSEARQIAIDEFERTYLEKLLKRHRGKINVSAKEAHITSRQLSRLVTKYGLDKKTFKP